MNTQRRSGRGSFLGLLNNGHLKMCACVCVRARPVLRGACACKEHSISFSLRYPEKLLVREIASH